MKKNTVITLGIVVIIILIGVYLVISSEISAEYRPNYTLEDFYIIPEKKVDVNEYTVSNIDDDEMVQIYFNTYMAIVSENINLAYTYLSEEDQQEVYPNIEAFKKKIYSLTNDLLDFPKIDRYEMKTEDGKKIYTISDKSGNIYVFHVEGVMKYTVSFE